VSSIYDQYPVGPCIRPVCDGSCFTLTKMIQMCSDFNGARVFIINSRPDEIAHFGRRGRRFREWRSDRNILYQESVTYAKKSILSNASAQEGGLRTSTFLCWWFSIHILARSVRNTSSPLRVKWLSRLLTLLGRTLQKCATCVPWVLRRPTLLER